MQPDSPEQNPSDSPLSMRSAPDMPVLSVTLLLLDELHTTVNRARVYLEQSPLLGFRPDLPPFSMHLREVKTIEEYGNRLYRLVVATDYCDYRGVYPLEPEPVELIAKWRRGGETELQAILRYFPQLIGMFQDLVVKIAKTSSRVECLHIETHLPGDAANQAEWEEAAESLKAKLKELESVNEGVIQESEQYAFRKKGEYWEISYEGHTFLLSNVKGLHYLAHLLTNPNRDFPVLDLVHAVEPASGTSGTHHSRMSREQRERDNIYSDDPNRADAVLDQRAMRDYKERIEVLSQMRQEAEDSSDQARLDAINEELEFISEELDKAQALGGKSRKFRTPVEKERSRVTGNINYAIAKIRKESPDLAGHLDKSISTGRALSYRPEIPIPWHF